MKTKIIATVGPSSSRKSTLKKMYGAGMNIARINTKHASRKFCLEIKQLLKRTDIKLLIDIKDLKFVEWLRDFEFDYLAISFAETGAQINKVKQILGKKNVRIISKIESKKGLRNVDEILKESDGLMIARGDLGKALSFEKVPVMQKLTIRKCKLKNKTAVTATEMLLSMLNSKKPSKADVSDIANAVFDGSNYLMLSEETAIGKYPVQAVATMNKIIRECEKTRRLLG